MQREFVLQIVLSIPNFLIDISKTDTTCYLVIGFPDWCQKMPPPQFEFNSKYNRMQGKRQTVLFVGYETITTPFTPGKSLEYCCVVGMNNTLSLNGKTCTLFCIMDQLPHSKENPQNCDKYSFKQCLCIKCRHTLGSVLTMFIEIFKVTGFLAPISELERVDPARTF